MRLQLAALIVAAATLVGPGSNRSEAQVMTAFGAPIVEVSPAMPAGAIVVGGIAASPVPQFPYSYYAAFPNPARQYVPYGPNDVFPFYGTPYGRPYDRWTWSYLAGPPNELQRYFYPPVR